MISADIYQLNFVREKENYTAYLSICGKSVLSKTPSCLSAGEILHYNTYNGTRKVEYFLSRMLTKDLVRRFYIYKKWQEIEVLKGIFGQPILRDVGCGKNLHLSIAHKKDLIGSLVFDAEHPLGLDIELVCVNPASLLKVIDENEIQELGQIGLSAIHAWSAKEALSKILRCGYTVDFSFFKIKNVQQQESSYCGEYVHFPQYRFTGFIAKEHVLTIAFPRKSSISIEKLEQVNVNNTP